MYPVVVAKTLDHTQAEGKVASLEFIAKRPSARGSSNSTEITFHSKIGKNIVKKFRLARVAERVVKEREKQDPNLGIIQQGGRRGRSPIALSYEQLGKCADF